MTTAIETHQRKAQAVEALRTRVKADGIPLTVVAKHLDLDVRSLEYWLEGRHLPAGKKLLRLERYLRRKPRQKASA